MKISSVRRIWMLFLLLASIPLGFITASAQIGQLGIYGSPPAEYRANVRYVRLAEYPVVEDGWTFTLPVNGLKNFNFYYNPDGNGFLSGGGYVVYYLAANQTTSYGYDIVSYSPNAGHTNGVAVRAFNNPPSSPLGINGTVYGYNQLGAKVALQNLVVRGSLGTDDQYAKTNGNGYFSLYYSSGNPGGFLASGDHRDVWITGFQNGCVYFHYIPGSEIIWSPDTDPNSSGYYVTDMDVTANIPTLACQTPEGD